MTTSLETQLELALVTYNRAQHLDRTLEQLRKGLFAGCRITILDNCSTDDTPTVCERHVRSLPQLSVVRHRRNIGASANYLRAVELARAPYTWVLADDDDLDFTDCQDVIDVILSGSADLISLGAPGQDPRERGRWTSAARLVASGARFFYVFTFVPGVVFRSELFDSHCVADGYRNVANLYPQFPFLARAVAADFSVYVARRQLVTRRPQASSDGDRGLPSTLFWLQRWARSCAFVPAELRARAIYEAAESRAAWARLLAVGIVFEKLFYPDRVWSKLARLGMELRGDQRILLLALSPLALVPSGAYGAVRRVLRGRGAHQPGAVDTLRY
jgi:glycosyltransferase involved in cell wall biosynthesis